MDIPNETQTNARRVAATFVEARKSGLALTEFPGERPVDLASAYEIQDCALALWDRPIGGWKVGRIGEPTAGELGADRLVGPIFADAIFQADEKCISMPIFVNGFAAAEAEFMLRLAPPTGAAVPDSNAQVMEWVDEIRIGIEIASSPYPDINRDGPCVTISDHGNNAGLVLGKTVDQSQWENLDAIAVALDIDGKNAGKGSVATMLDGPFGAVRFLLANLRVRGIEPQAGWWISSGAITGVHDVNPGNEVVARFAAIGDVRALVTRS